MHSKERVLDTLTQLHIPYVLMEHGPVHTIEDCLSIPDAQQNGAVIPRNAFLCNRQQTQFYLMLMQPHMPFRTAVVSKQLGISRLSFAPEAMLPELLGLHKGAVSPLGLLFDTRQRVRLVIDKALLQVRELIFHPCVNTASVRIAKDDFLSIFLPHTGHIPALVDCGQEE